MPHQEQTKPLRESDRGRRPAAPTLAQLGRPLLGALGLTLLIYGVYELVERLWLGGLPMEVLHLLHVVRGMVACLAVAAVVTWSILRDTPAFPATVSTSDDGSRRRHLTEIERTRLYAQWFITMRWIAVVVAALLVVLTVAVLNLLPPEVWRPLATTIAFLAACNLFYTALLHSNRGAATILVLQGYIDLVILTLLLHFSGGIENPLSTMMIFHVIIGGILLARGQCYGIAATGSLLFALLAWGEYANVLAHHTLLIFPHTESGGEILHAAHQPLFVLSGVLVQTAILFLTGYFVTTLSERLRSNERRLEAMADQAMADRQLLERALETTGTGLRVLDHNLHSYWANTRWKEWFARQPGVSRLGLELLHGDNSVAHQTAQDGQTRMNELTADPRDRTALGSPPPTDQRVFQITTAPLLDADGNVSEVVQLAQDITQQKQTQGQMIRAGKLAAVGELAGQVAHEVNNPIAIISAKAKLLLTDHRQEMSPKISQELVKITDLANRVARIAQGLLSYCRTSATAKTPLDIREPVRKSLALVEQPARTLGVEIQDRLPPTLPNVRANASELEQVFLNLFLNALDAMPQGGRLILSSPSTPAPSLAGQPCVAVSVQDSGPGIPEAVRERMFEPFFTTKKEGRGTGLGLSICLGLVRSHGGEITVETLPERGACFTVKLPADPASGKESRDG